MSRASPPSTVMTSIACTFDGASGTGVVPAALLSSLRGMSPAYAALSSRLDVTTVVDGLTIVMHSYQLSPTSDRTFNVTLQ